MKVSALACAAVFGLALAGCANTQASRPPAAQAARPTDTGSMAFPRPQPQGEIGSTAASGRQPVDTGNMAYPTPEPQGQVGSTAVGRRRPSDTGNMAYPAPLPQGNVGTTQVR